MRYVASDGVVYEYVSVDDEPKPPASYWLDHYGSCELGPKCECLKPFNPWLGRMCGNWRPVDVQDR